MRNIESYLDSFGVDAKDLTEPDHNNVVGYVSYLENLVDKMKTALAVAETVAGCDHCAKNEYRGGNCSGYPCKGFKILVE